MHLFKLMTTFCLEQLEYGLDNANPGFYDGEGLLGNEDDSASWSTTDTRIRHQLPLLDGSPSMMRKSRFFFQVSEQKNPDYLLLLCESAFFALKIAIIW